MCVFRICMYTGCSGIVCVFVFFGGVSRLVLVYNYVLSHAFERYRLLVTEYVLNSWGSWGV